MKDYDFKGVIRGDRCLVLNIAMDIHPLFAAPESKTLEFKRNLPSPKPISKPLVAFANTAEWTLIIGGKAGAWLGGFYGT